LKNEQYRQWCSMTPLVCSIVPIGVVSFIGIVNFAFPRIFLCLVLHLGDFGDLPLSRNLFPCCIVLLIALVAVPMGIFSILSGMAEIRVPYVKGKTLVVVAIIFGILDISAGAGFLFYLFMKFSKVF